MSVPQCRKAGHSATPTAGDRATGGHWVGMSLRVTLDPGTMSLDPHPCGGGSPSACPHPRAGQRPEKTSLPLTGGWPEGTRSPSCGQGHGR